MGPLDPIEASRGWQNEGGRALQTARDELLAAMESGLIQPRWPDPGIKRPGVPDRRSVVSSTSSYASSASSRSKASSTISSTSSSFSRASSVFSAPVRRRKRAIATELPMFVVPPFNYWCTSCDRGFKSKRAWKLHEEKRHYNPNRLMCPKPGCCRIFWDIDSFRQHLRFSSHYADFPGSESDVQGLGRGKRWACGFCAAVHTSRPNHLEHVAWHYAHGSTFADWSHSCVIRGLLLQPLVYDAWVSHPNQRPHLQWDRDITGRTELFACYDRPGQLQDRLEHFCGSAEDAQDLVDFAIGQAIPGPWFAFHGATSKTEARHLLPANVRQGYLSRPLPPLPPKGPPTLPATQLVAESKSVRQDTLDTTIPHPGSEGCSSPPRDGALISDSTQSTLTRAPVEEERPDKLTTEISSEKNARVSEQQSSAEKVPNHHSPAEDGPTFGFSESNNCYTALSSSSCSQHTRDSDSTLESGSPSEGETVESLSYESDEMAETQDVHVLSRSFEAMIDRVMEEFWVMWHHEWNGSFRQHARNSEVPAGQERPPESRHEDGTSPVGSAPSSGRGQSNDDSGNDDGRRDNPRRPPQTPVSSTALPSGQKFSCPFRKHDPITYSLSAHRVCAASSWDSTSRVKEHIYRCHRHLYCPRCKAVFENKSQLDLHVEAAREDICDVRPGRPPGITVEQERQLRSKKRPARGRSEEEKWRNIYALLFPNEDIPSCYFEPIEEVGCLSPEAYALEECEGYIRRQVPRLVRNNLIEVARKDMQPIEERLLARLHQITQDSIELAFRQFREARTDETHPQSAPPDSSPAHDAAGFSATGAELMAQASATQPNLSFLDDLFGSLPAAEGEFDELDMLAFLQPSSGAELSDSGYASGQPFCDTPSV